MIIFIVGFIVAQLFISVVCFGFESLEEELNEPIFSALVVTEGEDDDNLDQDFDGGSPTGIRVDVTFHYQKYPPRPLGVGGEFPPEDWTPPPEDEAPPVIHVSSNP